MANIRKDLLRKWEEKRPGLDRTIQEQGRVYFYTRGLGEQIAISDQHYFTAGGTYKDWHGWVMGRDYLMHHFPKRFTYYLTSSGNAGMSDFHYSDRLNEVMGEQRLRVVCFYPKHYDRKVLGPNNTGRWTTGKLFREEMETSSSGRVIRVDFNERFWSDNFESGETPCLDKMNEAGLDISRQNSMDITEGFKPTYSRIMENYGKAIIEKFGYFPRTLFVIQFGAGMLYDDCKAVAKARGWPADFLAVSTGNKDTVADKIFDSSETWQESHRDLVESGYTVAKSSGDRIYHVTDQEIIMGMSEFTRRLHLMAEPAGAVGMGFVLRKDGMTKRKITKKKYDLFAVINTGDGISHVAMYRPWRSF